VYELRIQTRWTDFDALGHLTHAAYPVFLDEARDAFLNAAVGPFADWPNVVAHLSLDYRVEVRHPAPEVTVRTQVERVGTTSVEFAQQVLTPGGEIAVAGRAVVVAWDPATRAARPITAADRTALTS
jgi:acyl-CoA thioesterase FadM